MAVTDSILTTVKQMVLGNAEDTDFDTDLIISINTVLMVVMQEWYGMDHAFTIEDDTATWEDLLGENVTDYDGVKTLVVLKVRMLFDPPTNSAVLQAMQEQIKDLEWRMYLWKDNERIDNGE